ncbi:MAG: PaaI family thioesterase [Pikeienuella sp.]
MSGERPPPPANRVAQDPSELLAPAEMGAISGLDFIKGMRDGRYSVPPIAQLMNMELVEVEAGRVVFQGRAAFAHYNPIGTVHGGWFGTLLDSCMACAVHSMLPRGRGYTTLEYRVNLIRPAYEDTGLLLAEGRAVHVGRRTGVAEGRLSDGAGKLYATGTTTCLVMEIAG